MKRIICDGLLFALLAVFASVMANQLYAACNEGCETGDCYDFTYYAHHLNDAFRYRAFTKSPVLENAAPGDTTYASDAWCYGLKNGL